MYNNNKNKSSLIALSVHMQINELIKSKFLSFMFVRTQVCVYGNWNGNVLFNDALNTFLTQLYGGYKVKDHSYSERLNSLSQLHGLLFPISSKGSFICTICVCVCVFIHLIISLKIYLYF